MITKRYGTIIADPPWSYRNAGCRGAAENHYPVMSIDDICRLPIAELADSDCALLLWATWPQLEEAMRVIQAWGFEYVTGMPWIKIVGDPTPTLFGEFHIKPQYGIGFWVRGASEPLLIARRGNAKPPTGGWIGLLSENLQHSRKPDNLYEYAECLPGPYLELFARRKRDGWDSWGNEVKNDLVLEAST